MYNHRNWIFKYLPKKSIGAEIGVWKGDFSYQIFKNIKPEKLYLIDPWKINSDIEYENAWYSSDNITQNKINLLYRSVINRFKDRPEIIIIRDIFLNAEVKDLDFCYIDGDHTYNGVKLDLETAYVKVKPNGFICGDDYSIGSWWRDGVIRAVTEFVNTYEDIELIKVKNAQYILKKVK